jgi:transcriptional regulator with XRE-family HTH domain
MVAVAKKSARLREDLTPERRARIDAKKREILQQVNLHELRLARERTQVAIADTMGIPQSAVSKIERRTDAYVSTVRRFLQALGGDLKIIAAFPDGTSLEITQFQEIGHSAEDQREAWRR